MKVKELREFLKDFPDEYEVLNERYSDMSIIKEDDFSLVAGVSKGDWVMRYHPTMSKENKANSKEYLLLRGN